MKPKNYSVWAALICIMVLTAAVQSCHSTQENGDTREPINYEYQIPEDIGDGWISDSLENVGMNSQFFVDLMNDMLNAGNRNIHCILVVKDSRLVFESYFPGSDINGLVVNYDNQTTHNTRSATKSITSTLLGITIDLDFVGGVTDKVYNYFPEYSQYVTPAKERMRLVHLLNMESGWEWLEWGVSPTSPESDTNKMYLEEDPIGYVLQKPVIHEPGTVFCYSGGVTNVLGQVIRNATQMGFSDFAHQYLLGPLGITDYKWARFPSGLEYVSGDLLITPRQMAKIGYLFINHGQWKGQQIISQKWIAAVSQKQDVTLPDYVEWAEGYGYHWWFQTYHVDSMAFDSFRAEGWGGQLIIMIPEMNMVIVFTGGNHYMDSNALGAMLREIVENTILASAFQ